MPNYTLILCEPDGRLIATVPESPILPRYLHVTADQIALSDSAEAPVTPDHTTTYARVASAVYVDDDRDALFIRVPA